MKTIMKTGIGAAALGAMLTTGFFIGEAFAYQGHMYAALDALRTARAELTAATPNKGGHRAAAIRYVNMAISETRAGIDYAR